MLHLAGYYKAVNPNGVETLLAAIPDQAIFTSGNDVRVPSGLPNLAGAYASYDGIGPKYGKVESPSLRRLANQAVLPMAFRTTGVLSGAGTPADTTVDVGAAFNQATLNDNFATIVYQLNQKSGLVNWLADSPRSLEASESVNFAINATGGAAAPAYGLIWLADGAVTPTKGKMFSVHATGTAALAAGAWVNTALAFDDVLPAGTYQVVGFRAQGPGLVAARIVFVAAAFRPGVIGDPDGYTTRMEYARYGRMGVFGQFDDNQPPTIDCLGSTDLAQDFVLDLIKVR